MRTREEIMGVANHPQEDTNEVRTMNNTGLILELLLDIRDLLSKPN